MNIGWSYYCDDPKLTLAQKVNEAVAGYIAKYGQTPNACFVHPSTLSPDGAPKLIGGVRVKASRSVIKDHYWLGVSDD